MTAIGFALFFIGGTLVLIIGRECPRPIVAIPILTMVVGGFALMVAGLAVMLWRIAP